MKVVKYVGQKQAGMPVHFPIGCKSKGGITHNKVANPYLELEDDEADDLLALDAGRPDDPAPNFEVVEDHEDDKDYQAWKAGGGKPKKVKLPQEDQQAIAAEKKAAKEAKAQAKKAAKEAEKTE